MEEFVLGTGYRDNFLTRSLANIPDDTKATNDDLLLAKDILERKFVVGLYERMEESLHRFARIFGWDALATNETDGCMRYGIHMRSPPGSSAGFSSTDLSREDPREFIERNVFDLELYHFAEDLFARQAEFT